MSISQFKEAHKQRRKDWWKLVSEPWIGFQTYQNDIENPVGRFFSNFLYPFVFLKSAAYFLFGGFFIALDTLSYPVQWCYAYSQEAPAEVYEGSSTELPTSTSTSGESQETTAPAEEQQNQINALVTYVAPNRHAGPQFFAPAEDESNVFIRPVVLAVVKKDWELAIAVLQAEKVLADCTPHALFEIYKAHATNQEFLKALATKPVHYSLVGLLQQDKTGTVGQEIKQNSYLTLILQNQFNNIYCADTLSEKQLEGLLDVFGLPGTATKDELAPAFRRVVFRWHPDKNPDNKEEAEEKTKALYKARDLLNAHFDKPKSQDEFLSTNKTHRLGEMANTSFRSTAFHRK